MIPTLFDPEQYTDPDYLAALKFVRKRGWQGDHLPSGYPSCEFCPIAVALSETASVHGWPSNWATLDAQARSQEMERIGGSSFLFLVNAGKVQYPSNWRGNEDDVLEGLSEDDSDLDWDGNGGEFLRYTEKLPAGVKRFVDRFDDGEFPSLHLDQEGDR